MLDKAKRQAKVSSRPPDCGKAKEEKLLEGFKQERQSVICKLRKACSAPGKNIDEEK